MKTRIQRWKKDEGGGRRKRSTPADMATAIANPHPGNEGGIDQKVGKERMIRYVNLYEKVILIFGCVGVFLFSV